MVAHETQGLYWFRTRWCAKPYSNGDAALVFLCSIIGVVAPSYIVDWNGGRWILSQRSLPSFIGRGGRVTMRTIRLTD
jgi:hypothetical protein